MKRKLRVIDEKIDSLYTRRNVAVRSLAESLKHLTPLQQIAIVSSWIPLTKLEKVVEFQKVKTFEEKS